MDRKEIMEVLWRCDLFSGLEREDIEKIATLGTPESYESGQSILCQGDFGDSLYVIAEGYVLLERSIDIGARKCNAVISLLGRGRTLGCWATLLGEGHNLMSSAVCRKPTRMVVIQGQDLRRMMEEDARLGFRILERLCTILRDRIQGAYGAMENL